MEIQPYNADLLNAVISLSLRAWAPVFESMQNVLNPDIYREFYPDWQVEQQQAVEDACGAEDTHVWVAIEDTLTVGFVAVKLHPDSKMGEIHMLAVDPNYQHRGIGIALTNFALDWMKEEGMSIAMVETGADPGHSPARHTYVKAGFELLPIARYFKKL